MGTLWLSFMGYKSYGHFQWISLAYYHQPLKAELSTRHLLPWVSTPTRTHTQSLQSPYVSEMSSRRVTFDLAQGGSHPSEHHRGAPPPVVKDEQITRLRAEPSPVEIRNHLVSYVKQEGCGVTTHFSWEYMKKPEEKRKFINLFAEFAQLKNKNDEKWWALFDPEWKKFWDTGSGMEWRMMTGSSQRWGWCVDDLRLEITWSKTKVWEGETKNCCQMTSQTDK